MASQTGNLLKVTTQHTKMILERSELEEDENC